MSLFGGKVLSENTIKLYEANLKRLNGGVLPTSPTFLKNTDAVMEKIEKFSMNTKKTYFITIVSYLKDKKIPKKVIKFYMDKMDELNKTFEEHKGEKTQTQEKNWIEWDQVIDHYNKLNPASLAHLVLALFVLQPPRRSKDYFLMKIVPEYNETMDKDFNYLDWKNMRFYFNNYKTKGAYGTQTVDVSPELQEVFHNHFPLKKKFAPFFLLQRDGERLPDNGITRILNTIFGKKISVSMLRNIYLSSKYGEQQKAMENDASLMGTSTDMASNVYTKNE
jgi:integrase